MRRPRLIQRRIATKSSMTTSNWPANPSLGVIAVFKGC